MSTAESEAAPGRLESLRLLINTIALPKGPDELDGVEAASAWCREHGMSPIANGAELEKLIGFREALREVLYANNGESDPKAAWARLETYARTATFGLAVDEPDGPVLEPRGEGVERNVAWMLGVVYDAVADGSWRRLRACKRSDCRWAYFDSSKNGSRAWCSMATCGNREKAQRRRAREHS